MVEVSPVVGSVADCSVGVVSSIASPSVAGASFVV